MGDFTRDFTGERNINRYGKSNIVMIKLTYKVSWFVWQNKKDLTEEVFHKCTHCAVGQANDLSKLLFELAVYFHRVIKILPI